ARDRRRRDEESDPAAAGGVFLVAPHVHDEEKNAGHARDESEEYRPKLHRSVLVPFTIPRVLPELRGHVGSDLPLATRVYDREGILLSRRRHDGVGTPVFRRELRINQGPADLPVSDRTLSVVRIPLPPSGGELPV